MKLNRQIDRYESRQVDRQIDEIIAVVKSIEKQDRYEIKQIDRQI